MRYCFELISLLSFTIAVVYKFNIFLFQAVNEPFNQTINNTSYTFQVCDKIPEKVDQTTDISRTSHLVSSLYGYRRNHCIRVIQGTDFSQIAGLFEPIGKNGFVNTAIECYNRHHNFVIRPDDIWAAIITQFSFYINANAERFRSLFVNFDGTKELEVHLGSGTLDSVSYAKFVELMEQKIDENIVNREIRNWIMPNFTTTTQDDKISAGVIFMATLKKYFAYHGRITCGIPKITLEGNFLFKIKR